MMRKILFGLLFIVSSTVYADDISTEESFTPIQINYLYDEPTNPNILEFQDLVDKEEKISACVVDYVEKQRKKTYARNTKQTLYDLVNNFKQVVSRIYGAKKSFKDDVPYEEKLDALAKVQCEAYYTMSVLK